MSASLPGWLAPLGLVVGFGALAYWFSRGAGPAKETDVPTTSAGGVAGVGWLTEPDVVLTEWITDTADQLSAALAADGGPALTLLITSGKRSALAQAQAIRWRIDHGDDQAALEKLYRAHAGVIREIYPLLIAGDLEAAAEVLERDPISAHQRGEAADLHRPDDPAEGARIKAAGAAADVRVLDEGNVLHLGA